MMLGHGKWNVNGAACVRVMLSLAMRRWCGATLAVTIARRRPSADGGVLSKVLWAA